MLKITYALAGSRLQNLSSSAKFSFQCWTVGAHSGVPVTDGHTLTVSCCAVPCPLSLPGSTQVSMQSPPQTGVVGGGHRTIEAVMARVVVPDGRRKGWCLPTVRYLHRGALCTPSPTHTRRFGREAGVPSRRAVSPALRWTPGAGGGPPPRRTGDGGAAAPDLLGITHLCDRSLRVTQPQAPAHPEGRGTVVGMYSTRMGTKEQ
mmetsp:Transcript_43963/g.78982  ORF Transcript_43963/g.78982 Transcript_43963/m.78982 type:complete len:204 (+) Transcript_43963:303-914(+)